MEIDINNLYGKELIEIHKIYDRIIHLVFKDFQRRYTLSYKGFLFESENTPLGCVVSKVSKSAVLGIKAISTIEYHNLFSNQDFRQVMIHFNEGAFVKEELICVGFDFKLQ